MRGFKSSVPALFHFLAVIMLTTSCKQKVVKLASPPHYNFAHAEPIKLDEKIREISGIVLDSKNDIILAITDEAGKIFTISKTQRTLTGEYDFGDPGDYEDIALYNGVPYVLRSDGQITKVINDDPTKPHGVVVGKLSISGTNDFETMYADPGRKALIVVCKNCSTDDPKSVSAFAFYPDSTGYDNKPIFRFDADAVEKLSPFKTSKFQPSAAAVNPEDHKLYILSSASSQLVIADTMGKVESVFKLSKSLFPQPEGLTFSNGGTMFISNEGPRGKPTLLVFDYVDSAKAQIGKAGYDFTTPTEKMELGKHLHEISGMAYIPKTGNILGENDEKGDIFTFDFKNRNDNVSKEKFGGKGDYEDIVYTDTAIYMLVSSGSIIRVSTKDSSFATTEYVLPGEKNEFETLYLDADSRSLIMLCKECAHEKKTGVRVAYRFDLKTNSFDAAPAYTIDIADIQKILGDDQAEFKPSAAAINPINGKLYIVASVGKLLVIADKKTGKPEQVFKLDPALYNQPEGMTFAPNGDLYISNEGGEGIATVLKFVYKK